MAKFASLLLGTAFAIGVALSSSSALAGDQRSSVDATEWDYRDSASWLAVPRSSSRRHSTAAFVVHPTTFYSSDVGNATMDWERSDSSIADLHRNQAGIFTDCCSVFLPYYRQASVAAVFAEPSAATAAYNLAYLDVRAAFVEFLRRNAAGPIALFGHSQGALHVLRLLRDEVAGTPTAHRLVAAYVIGIGAADAEPGVADRGIPPCTTPYQTGCYLGWSTFLSGADASGYVARNASSFADRGGQGPYRPICISPATFSAAHDDDAQGSEGTCRDGVVRVSDDKARQFKPIGQGNMHMHDVSLFTNSIRDNLTTRTRAWLLRHNLPQHQSIGIQP